VSTVCELGIGLGLGLDLELGLVLVLRYIRRFTVYMVSVFTYIYLVDTVTVTSHARFSLTFSKIASCSFFIYLFIEAI